MSKFARSLLLMAMPVMLAAPAQALKGPMGQTAGGGAAASQAQPTNEWLTWGYDQERTGWNRAETTLSTDNVSKLGVQWQAKLDVPVTNVALSTLTAPIVADGVATPQGAKALVYILSANNVLFALDAATGGIVWRKEYQNPVQAGRDADWLCPNTANATPVVDKQRGILFFITSDGKLRGASLGDGSDMMAPVTMVAPFARAWSLNLINGIVYTTSGRACGEPGKDNPEMLAALSPEAKAQAAARNIPPIDPSAVTAADVNDLNNPQVTRFYTSNARQAAPWGRGGTARGPGDTVLLETSDGLYDPASGNFSDSILRLAPRATRLVDSFTPKNHKQISARDLGGSASPIVFPYDGKTLVAMSQKEAVMYLLDAEDLGGGPPEQHSAPIYRSPRIANDAGAGTDPSQGVWGSLATYETPEGERFVYAPVWGPPSTELPAFKRNNGPIEDGSIMAFRVTGTGENITMEPEWSSPNMIMPDPPVIANGVLYAIQTGGQAKQNPRMPDGSRYDARTNGAEYRATPVSNLVLYAMDAKTGDVLYSSKDAIKDWVHFSEPVVAQGKVFVVTHDAHVYAFGLKR